MVEYNKIWIRYEKWVKKWMDLRKKWIITVPFYILDLHFYLYLKYTTTPYPVTIIARHPKIVLRKLEGYLLLSGLILFLSYLALIILISIIKIWRHACILFVKVEWLLVTLLRFGIWLHYVNIPNVIDNVQIVSTLEIWIIS